MLCDAGMDITDKSHQTAKEAVGTKLLTWGHSRPPNREVRNFRPEPAFAIVGKIYKTCIYINCPGR